MDKQLWEEKLSKYTKMLQDLGSDSQTIIDPATVVTVPWAIHKCKYGCKKYGTSHICPPQTPSYKETREILDCYQVGILFRVHDDGVATGLAMPVARELFLDGYYKALAFGAGPCYSCKDCHLDTCRFPDKVTPAMEACGVDVFATVRNNGYEIQPLRDKDAQGNYFGLLLVE